MTPPLPRVLATIPTTGRRELVLSVEHPGELVLSVQWPTAVHPESRVMLDERAAADLLGALARWCGVADEGPEVPWAPGDAPVVALGAEHVPGQLPLPDDAPDAGAWL